MQAAGGVVFLSYIPSMVKKQSSSFSSKNNTNKKHTPQIQPIMSGFASISEDLIQNILIRLPALSFASAACVTKLWHHICTRILSRPKLASAISLKLSTDLAIEEVLVKVLSEPIRPHFAIASVGCGFGLKKTLRHLVEKLGSRTPIVLSSTIGIMGRDASSNNFKEVMFVDPHSDSDEHMDASSGIVLTIGYVPGLKVEAIPLLRPTKAPQVAMVDDFVMDIRNYTLSVSGCTSPIGIIMFGDRGIDQKPVIEKLDYAMSPETIIVGDERAQFLYRSGTESRSVCGSLKYFSDAVALVFAKDRSGPHARVTDIQFHAALSTGVSAIGPRYKAVSVKVNDHDRGTWLTAKREGEQEVLDGQTILDDVNDELDNRAGCPDLYIGIIKRRKCSIGNEKSKPTTFLTFHGVIGGDEEYLYVDGLGIKTADYFQVYHSDPSSAISSSHEISEKLRKLKQDFSSHQNSLNSRSPTREKEFIGGLIFSCCGRGETFFGHDNRNVDSSPLVENFSGIPLAGIFCGGEIGRGFSLSSINEEGVESSNGAAHCSLHVYSTVYLLISYSITSQADD
ncbi:F-box/LRR-repeat protein At5g63520 [Linum perenne]